MVFFLAFLLVVPSFAFVRKVNSAGGASLFFSPASGQKVVGDTFAVAVVVNTGGNSINAGDGSITFASDKLQVLSVSKAGSIFSLWAAEPSFSNSKGTVEFAGGIPNPGYNGSNGIILTINFKAKAATVAGGSAEVVVASGTILANDGEGTNILSGFGKASFSISPASIPSQTLSPSPETKPATLTQSILIKSSTHPDQEKWYADNAPVFNWELPPGVETVSYLVTNNPTSKPGTIPDGLVNQAKFTDITNGVNYFHLRFKENGAWGPISHFKFQVDTQSPREFKVLVTDDNSPEPKLTFESSDNLSGIDHYEIKINKKDWVVIDKSLAGKSYGITNQGYGKHLVQVKAIDGAGNSTMASAKVSIPGGSWNKFGEMIWNIFRNWMSLIAGAVLAVLARKFLEFLRGWKKTKKN